MSHPARAPVAPRASRLESLDVVRGLAVLGIYMVNVEAFAMTSHGYANPTIEADFGAQGQAVWLFVETGFRMKFITIFTALFGAGIVLMLGEDDSFERDALHMRRMLGLFVFGVIHAYAFWYGDILVPYAVVGFFAAGARRWPVGRLIGAGVGLVLLSTVLFFLATASTSVLEPDEYAKTVAEQWAPPPDEIAAQVAMFRAPWLARLGGMADLAFTWEAGQLTGYLPRFLGLMLLGMALQKAGFFSRSWPIGRHAALALLAPLSALVSWLAARSQIAAGFDLASIAPAQAVFSLASVPQALGYASLAMLISRPKSLALVRAPFAAAGRMALSCYLGCTLVSWFVFYGPPGLGRIGTLTRLEQVWTALWVWAGVLVFAIVWLRFFRFGPMEWAWRSLTYGRPQRLLKRASDPPPLAPHDDIK